MTAAVKNVAVLGATGSVGRNALQVIAASEGRLRAAAISGRKRLGLLSELAAEFKPAFVVATDAEAAEAHDWSTLPEGTQVHHGASALETVVADPSIDVVLASIVGAAGLRSTWAALEAGKQVALANKETLVMAGPLIGDLTERSGGQLLPVDSEHSAIFQAMKAGAASEVERLVLTASGGPFRTWPEAELINVTVEDALAHPTWNMGPKITVDSATLMNKALELIEARWLFDVPAERLAVMIHPQSVIHSLVEFVDGSVVAQMGPPDMKLPIQYALDYPNRTAGPAERLDWTAAHALELLPADTDR
ncbi:MAG: 1-deoxy-D-xylulose-5-phosphate reductoisomerase, partial [Planctomycetota bacterium]